MAISTLQLSYDVLESDAQILAVIRKLEMMGYDCQDEYDIVRCIEMHCLDVSQFQFPGGSYEVFRKNVNDGKYDVMLDFVSKEELEQSQKDVYSGKTFVVY